LLIQPPGFQAIERGQVHIQRYALAARHDEPINDQLDFRQASMASTKQ
jgi:hypothetical protein